MFGTNVEIEQSPSPIRSRTYLEGLGLAEHRSNELEDDLESGANLYITEFLPDDIHLTRTRIESNVERIDADGDIPEATIVADATLLRIMLEFFDADGRKEGLESEDFHIHQDPELREYVKECMRRAVETELGEDVADAWLESRLALIQGFPPYSYVEMDYFDETGEENDSPAPSATERKVAALAIATTVTNGSLQAA